MFGSVVFVLIGLWLLISPPEISNPILGNKTVIFISGIAALLFFGTTAAISLKKIMQRIPGLIISKEGIYDNSSAITVGLIKWEDLVDIGVVEVQKQKLLMLYVQNPQEYIRSQKNAFKRTIMQINYKSYSTPISIGVHGLKCNFDELHSLLKQYMELAQL